MKRIGIVFLLFFINLSFVLAQAQLIGKVIRVSDGDTIVLLDKKNSQHRIRLHGIDCPERHQDYYQAAKNHTSNLCFGKLVRVDVLDTDRYGRIVGRVWSNEIDVNLSLLENGLAWHYTYFDKTILYAKAHEKAKRKQINIWSKPNPIAPWDFRRK